MSCYFTLITDKEIKYKELLHCTTKYFNLNNMRVSYNNVKAIHENFIIDISPRQLRFLIVQNDEQNTIKSLKEFIIKYFKNRILCISYSKEYLNRPFQDINEVTIIEV